MQAKSIIICTVKLVSLVGGVSRHQPSIDHSSKSCVKNDKNYKKLNKKDKKLDNEHALCAKYKTNI